MQFEGKDWVLVDGQTQVTKTGHVVPISRAEAEATFAKLTRYLENNVSPADNARWKAKADFLKTLLGD